METLPALPNTQIEVLLSQAIDKGVTVETLERLLAMRDKLKMEYAKEAFDLALSTFQGECPVIKKTKSVTINGVTAYKYAPLESIVEQVKPLLAKNNLSYRIETETLEKTVKSICIVLHAQGHSERSSFEIPLGQKTALMNASQHVAAALTFAKRHAFCNAFGILTGDEDTDSKVNTENLCTLDQVSTIRELIALKEWKEEDLLKKGNITALTELSYAQAELLIRKLSPKP